MGRATDFLKANKDQVLIGLTFREGPLATLRIDDDVCLALQEREGLLGYLTVSEDRPHVIIVHGQRQDEDEVVVEGEISNKAVEARLSSLWLPEQFEAAEAVTDGARERMNERVNELLDAMEVEP